MAAALPIIGIISTVGSGVMSAIGAEQTAAATAAADRQNADVAAANKLIADQDRRVALQAQSEDTNDLAQTNRRNLSSIRAAYGSSGFEMAGTPLSVLADTARAQAVGQLRTQAVGNSVNRQYAIKMMGYDQNQQQDLAAANAATAAGHIDAIGALLNTGARLTRVN